MTRTDELDVATDAGDFDAFVRSAEPRIRRSLCAGFGRETGRAATSEALSYGWEHWDKVRTMENPVGYLYAAGRNAARRITRADRRRRDRRSEPGDEGRSPWVEPRLETALMSLSERERMSVVLVHGYEWTLGEVAELSGISKGSIQKYLERGMRKLERRMGVKQ